MIEVKDDALYTRADLIAGLGVSDRTIRRDIQRGKLPKPAPGPGGDVWPGSVLRRHFEKLQAKAEARR